MGHSPAVSAGELKHAYSYRLGPSLISSEIMPGPGSPLETSRSHRAFSCITVFWERAPVLRCICRLKKNWQSGWSSLARNPKLLVKLTPVLCISASAVEYILILGGIVFALYAL
ncbi:hypothetical protein SISNIDRAFT_229298 [Sistotremastrum niveocremeum HHB9708]|uniref:Uncharacterized protein n=1 Tax=Sistotremastrum niveocremeum HHB9708 TaxID=1314777 RepID=A0A164Q620_9AGAM|nr:hypothetical protein SISNIDRAFT_229298 [Sistotremastrum niveocremeum HHB9708]